MSKPIHIGTSGWDYPHWKGRFYPADLPASKRLAYYAGHFQIVELNNTFYRLPNPEAVKRWRATSPPGFHFAVKGSRFLTHMKKLKDPAPGLERFFERVNLLKQKLGPVLFQLPPHWEINEERLRIFLEALPQGHRYAFEFRDPSWNTPSIYNLLTKFHAAYCIFELAGFQSPLQVTTGFTYIRLHGPDARYQGSYDDSKLRFWARSLRQWDLETAYVFFDNDEAAYAVENAGRLRALVSE